MESLNEQSKERTEAITPPEHLEEEYFKDLGINWEYLKNKKILEIGAGLAQFAQIAKEKGIEIMSLEKTPKLWDQNETLPHDVLYVRGEAEKLPFPDASFDVLISRAAPPTISQTKEEIKAVVEEARRVLKKGGEFRFGPGGFLSRVFQNELFTPEEMRTLSRAKRIKRINKASLEFLQTIDPNITEEGVTDESQVEIVARHYYVLRKPKEDTEDEIDEKEIISMLEYGDEAGINRVAELLGKSVEEIKLLSKFSQQRAEMLKEINMTYEKIHKHNIPMTEEEKRIGTHLAILEPQVRSAVRELTRKGYATYESGFYLPGIHQRIGFREPYFQENPFSQDFLTDMRNKGINLHIKPNAIELNFYRYLSNDEIKAAWDRIIETLPSYEKTIL